jgi:hypothetical protein
MEQHIFEAFVRGLKSEQDRLRDKMEPYESGRVRIARGHVGGSLLDITAETIEDIGREIARIERTIQFVTAWQEGRNA